MNPPKTLKSTLKIERRFEKAPILNFGKYMGIAIDKVPTSYCRWILSQQFSDEIMYWARKKVGVEITNRIDIEVTRHALDKYSLNFLDRWQAINEGLASFVARKALEAWERGSDVSKNRHQDEQIIKSYEKMRWVFNKGGESRVLITVE